MSEKTCKDCIHFDACSKWTDFPKQCGVPVCARYEEQSEGEWIDTGDEQLDKIYSGYKCSACGFIICGHSGNYCSECGAKMKGYKT